VTPGREPDPSTGPQRARRLAAFDAWNFRAYFAGQLLSSVGTWMQTFSLGWLVIELTGRSDKLGVAVALQFLPLLLFGAQAGVLADRVDNRRLLIATSAAGGLLALALGTLTLAGHGSIWWVYVFATLFGFVSAVERPAMSAIIFQLVGGERLTSAVSINGIINTAARLVGPSIAGVVIAVWSIAGCFFVNAASYVVVIAALTLLRTDELIDRPRRARGAGGLREGIRYVRSHPDVRRPLVVMAIVGTLAYNFQTTIPSMVKFGFDRGAGATAAVMSLSAIGSIAAGLVVAGLRLHPRTSLALSCIGLGVGMTAFGAAPTYLWFVAACIPLGFLSSSFLTIDATVLQQATDPAMQGRVMGLHQIAWFGSTPIGAILMGWIIETTSPRMPFFVGAATALACGVVVAAGHRRTGVQAGEAGEAGAVGHGVATSS
jgi:MFS family permease